jgi:ketosteroid isomerase-like protein
MWHDPHVSTESTRAVVQDYYSALRKGDRTRLKELLAPDAILIPPPSSSTPRRESADAIIDLLCGGSLKDTFDFSQPFALEIRRIVAEDNIAVVQQHLTATAKATGKAYDNQYCWVYEIRDGRIAVLEEYADTVVAGRAMGTL